jgi:predicted dehydrogenase
MSVGFSRRFFVGGLLAAGAVGCAGIGGYRANSKVRLAVIGCGGQGAWDVDAFEQYPDLCEIVALVDTDIGAEHTLRTLRKYPNLPRFTDFRKMFDKMDREIDAVLVATPDHAHFCICLEAIRRGKAVYVEKPLAHSFRECELLMKAEAEEGVVCQMGNQGHSGNNFYQYRDYVKAGIFSLAALEKLTGIDQKQLWSYTKGTKPRKAQADRIRAGFLNLSKDLDAIFA